MMMMMILIIIIKKLFENSPELSTKPFAIAASADELPIDAVSVYVCSTLWTLLLWRQW